MKKLIFSSSLLISSLFCSQSNRLIVEIDNSQKYIYENTLNKLRADSYKREIAEGIKIHAENYFKELQKIADYFEPIDYQHKPMLNNEIEKLKVYGEDILKLLKDLDQDRLTGVRMKYVIAKGKYELEHLSDRQEFRELTIYRAFISMRTDLFPTVSEEDFFVMIKEISGVNKEQLIQLQKSNFTHLTLKEFLIEQYEKYYFLKAKYK